MAPLPIPSGSDEPGLPFRFVADRARFRTTSCQIASCCASRDFAMQHGLAIDGMEGAAAARSDGFPDARGVGDLRQALGMRWHLPNRAGNVAPQIAQGTLQLLGRQRRGKQMMRARH